MKKVLITGVLGGMGSATMKRFLDEGYEVYGLDRKDISTLPINYYKIDIQDMNTIINAYNDISLKVDFFDVIIHFAGFYNMDSLIEIEDIDFMKIFDVNLFGIYRINKVFYPLLKKNSKIIMTSSELAPLDPLPFTGLYAITKSAVEKYAYSLRMELNLKDIKVSLIRPGAVRTNMLGASTSSMDKLCEKTVIYKNNANKFKHIVESIETKNIDPSKIANIAFKISKSKRPKYIYNVNRNVLLRLLNILPTRAQVYIIGKILKK